MPAIKQGETLTKNDLKIYIYSGQNLTDPFSITYTLYDSTTGSDVIIGLPDRTPIKFGIGSYYAPWEVPADEPTGLHKILWKYKETATSVIKTQTEEFDVSPICTAVTPQYPDFIKFLIRQLRIKLRDVNPDRDYHFSPPEKEATIAGFSETRGYRWPDEHLYSHLLQARNYLNLIPPDTDFDLGNYPSPWQPLLLMQAMVYALWDLSILWINEEFHYDVNGISLDISRSDKYQSVAQTLQETLSAQLVDAKRRVHIIRGLAQSKYVYGRGAAMGPWCIFWKTNIFDILNNEMITIEEAFKRQIKLSYSMDDKNNLIQNEVMKIWCNGEQELFKLILENDYEIICTETHKFFDEKNKENELNKFSIGDFIWIEHNNVLVMEKIKKIEKYGKEMTYDMEMKEPFRNYIANRFVVHNTGGANIKRWIGGGIGLSGVRVGW